MNEFLNMGGYGGYVWPAYIASILVLGILAFSIWRRSKSLSHEISQVDGANSADEGNANGDKPS